jgi:hypothetical protein
MIQSEDLAVVSLRNQTAYIPKSNLRTTNKGFSKAS